MPTIVYSCVVDSKKEIKAEFPSGQGNLREVVLKIVNSGNFVRYAHKRSLRHKNDVIFHYAQFEEGEGFTVFCIADKDMPYYICYNMIDEVKKKTQGMNLSDSRTLKSTLSGIVVRLITLIVF